MRAAVKGAQAETYLLISLTAFAGSVIVTRLFLALTGYPQVGNSVLHIAHALWGALLLVAAVLLPLTLANGWAFTLSALLSGLGIGLFIDEVGKFITQANDYFFPPAAPVIYAFFLLLVLLLLLVRRRGHPDDPRAEMYRALAGLRELLDNNLDTRELETLLAHLEVARRADQPHVAGLAAAVHTYLTEAEIPLLPARPGRWRRFTHALSRWGSRLGRGRHRALILAFMALLGLGTLVALGLLLYLVAAPETARQQLLALMTQAEIESAAGGFWYYLRMVLEGLVGLIALASIYLMARGREPAGINAALLALLLSLTGVVLLAFYLYQFRAAVTALFQFGVLLLVLAYRRWYLEDLSS